MNRTDDLGYVKIIAVGVETHIWSETVRTDGQAAITHPKCRSIEWLRRHVKILRRRDTATTMVGLSCRECVMKHVIPHTENDGEVES